jgi:hypothetical protein
MRVYTVVSALGASVLTVTATKAHIPRRDQAPSCDGVPGGFDFISQFELYAVNATMPNDPTIGTPLVIAPTSIIDGVTYWTLTVRFRSFRMRRVEPS